MHIEIILSYQEALTGNYHKTLELLMTTLPAKAILKTPIYLFEIFLIFASAQSSNFK